MAVDKVTRAHIACYRASDALNKLRRRHSEECQCSSCYNASDFLREARSTYKSLLAEETK